MRPCLNLRNGTVPIETECFISLMLAKLQGELSLVFSFSRRATAKNIARMIFDFHHFDKTIMKTYQNLGHNRVKTNRNLGQI